MAFINFLHTHSPSPILFEIGPIKIYWYGTLYLVSFALAYFIVSRLLARNSSAESKQLLLDLPDFSFGLIITGLVGARLYHVLNEWSYYWEDPREIIAVWHGGLAIHGALIAGALYVWWYARKHQYSFLWLTDLVTPVVLLGQAIGRWGNYFNQELFGRPTNLPWGIPIDPENRPAGFESFVHFHPTFLYESLWDLLGVAILLTLQKKYQQKTGGISAVYLIIFGLGRLGVELLRIDTVFLLLSTRLPFLVSLGIILAGTALLFIVRTRKKMI